VVCAHDAPAHIDTAAAMERISPRRASITWRITFLLETVSLPIDDPLERFSGPL
jgi:hypothetical protein